MTIPWWSSCRSHKTPALSANVSSDRSRLGCDVIDVSATKERTSSNQGPTNLPSNLIVPPGRWVSGLVIFNMVRFDLSGLDAWPKANRMPESKRQPPTRLKVEWRNVLRGQDSLADRVSGLANDDRGHEMSWEPRTFVGSPNAIRHGR